MTDRGNYVLESLESADWVLLQPLDLWSYQRGNCWVVGDYGPFQLMAEGGDFETARDNFCRVLVDCADYAAERGELYSEWIGRVAATAQDWQDTATDAQGVTLDVTDCAHDE